MTFSDLSLSPSLLQAIKEEGYTQPSPIQEQAIPIVLQGKDLLACAQTGTGKTAAFALPILQLMSTHMPSGPKSSPKCLILTPTRELAIQILESFQAYGRHLKIRSMVIFGGVGQAPQVELIKKGVDILIATPGRLLDLHQQGLLDLKHVAHFVLDEADRMLDMGFVHDVRRIIHLLPVKRQSLFFSATMPDEIIKLAEIILTEPQNVKVNPVSSTAELIEQMVYFIDQSNKTALLLDLLNAQSGSVLVFTRTKHGANKLCGQLEKKGIKAEAIHGNKSQTARQRALLNFRQGTTRVLVATDLASRGIDIDDLSLVIQYEIPNVPETYVHRIGRTGRAGASGLAIGMVSAEEVPYIRDIEKLIRQKIPVMQEHAYPMKEKVVEKLTISERPASTQTAKNKKRQFFNNNRKPKPKY